jgi:hypothetical protein
MACDNDVADHEDHCRAGHPCSPVAAVESPPTKDAVWRGAGAAFPFEELACGAADQGEGEHRWFDDCERKMATAFDLEYEETRVPFKDLDRGDLFMHLGHPVEVIHPAGAVDSPAENPAALWCKALGSEVEWESTFDPNDVVHRVQPTLERRRQLHEREAARQMATAEALAAQGAHEAATHHYSQAAVHHIRLSQQLLWEPPFNQEALNARKAEYQEALDLARHHFDEMTSGWSSRARAALALAREGAPLVGQVRHVSSFEDHFDAEGDQSNLHFPRFRGETRFTTSMREDLPGEDDRWRARTNAMTAVMYRGCPEWSSPATGALVSCFLDNPHDTIDQFVASHPPQGAAYSLGVADAHRSLDAVGIHRDDTLQSTWER